MQRKKRPREDHGESEDEDKQIGEERPEDRVRRLMADLQERDKRLSISLRKARFRHGLPQIASDELQHGLYSPSPPGSLAAGVQVLNRLLLAHSHAEPKYEASVMSASPQNDRIRTPLPSQATMPSSSFSSSSSLSSLPRARGSSLPQQYNETDSAFQGSRFGMLLRPFSSSSLSGASASSGTTTTQQGTQQERQKRRPSASQLSNENLLDRDKYKKWRLEDNIPLLEAMAEKGRKWDLIKEVVNNKLQTDWHYGRVKHRCRHLLQEKRPGANKDNRIPFGEVHLRTALYLHHRLYHDKFNYIQAHPLSREEMARGFVPLHLFSVATIEQNVLQNCACSSCRHWGLDGYSDGEFANAWTKEKALRLKKLVLKHVEHERDWGRIRTAVGWGPHWKPADVQARIRSICNGCHICTKQEESKISSSSSSTTK